MFRLTWYADRAMTMREPDGGDQISDSALDHRHLPDPYSAEVIHARHSDDQSLDLYGYAGEWHSSPPPEARAYDRACRAARKNGEPISEVPIPKMDTGDGEWWVLTWHESHERERWVRGWGADMVCETVLIEGGWYYCSGFEKKREAVEFAGILAKNRGENLRIEHRKNGYEVMLEINPAGSCKLLSRGPFIA